MRRTGRVEAGEAPRYSVLGGGVSCATVRIDFADGRSWVVKQALPRLRVEVEWLSDPARIHREALAMDWFGRTIPGSVPSLVFEDEAAALVAMTTVPAPHRRWKDMLLAGEVEGDHVHQFGELLGVIHRTGAADAAAAAVRFEERSFYESLRLEPYYAYSATRRPEAAPFLEMLVAETRSHRWTIVHGDYSPKNVLIHDGRIHLIDHEVIHWGDGGFDLGFAFAHFLAKSHHVAGAHDDFCDAARWFWQSYRGGGPLPPAAGPGYEARVVRHAIGCTLARAVGRSPLEYLTERQRARQAAACISLAADPPQTVAGLVDAFCDAVGGG